MKNGPEWKKFLQLMAFSQIKVSMSLNSSATMVQSKHGLLVKVFLKENHAGFNGANERAEDVAEHKVFLLFDKHPISGLNN